MEGYVDFRLMISPDLVDRGKWQVTVDDCPLPGLIGPKGSVVPAVTRKELNTLRGRNGWPDPANLRQIGKAVWQSMMLPAADAAFQGSLEIARQSNQGLRLVLIIQGEDNPQVRGDTAIRLSELPTEAIYSDMLQFLATDLRTPISRSFQQRPDCDPQRVVPPLRVLVAVAAPTDKPPARVAMEVKAISDAVADLTEPGGLLEVDFVEQATRKELALRLKLKSYQVFHFVGHGGFDIVGDVEAPRAHLCFVREDGSGMSDPTDADTLTTMLKNSSIRLAVITACSSAAPTPPVPDNPIDAGPLGTGAFEGVAQRLVTGVSPVIAAVGMQFDLEDVAAVEFSRAFYQHLLSPGTALDEAVTHARKALVNALGAGHRAWVSPAVYWRCKNGMVFDIDPQRVEIDEKTLEQIHDLDVQLDFHRAQIEKIVAKPQEERMALQPFRLDSIRNIETLQGKQADLYGESLRVGGGCGAPGQEIRCRTSLRLRRVGTVDLVQFTVEYPPKALSFVGADPGAEVAVEPLISAATPGVVHVALINPGDGQQWAQKAYELAFLRFVVADDVQPSVLDVKVAAPRVTTDGGQPTNLRSVDGVVFVDEASLVAQSAAGETEQDRERSDGVAQSEPPQTLAVLVPNGVGTEIDTDVLVDAYSRLEIIQPCLARLHERIDAAIEAHRPGEDWRLRLSGPLNQLSVCRESLEQLNQLPQRWMHIGEWIFTFNDTLRNAILTADILKAAIEERINGKPSFVDLGVTVTQLDNQVKALVGLINRQR